MKKLIFLSFLVILVSSCQDQAMQERRQFLGTYIATCWVRLHCSDKNDLIYYDEDAMLYIDRERGTRSTVNLYGCNGFVDATGFVMDSTLYLYDDTVMTTYNGVDLELHVHYTNCSEIYYGFSIGLTADITGFAKTDSTIDKVEGFMRVYTTERVE